jgi:hypothetical protein
MAKEGKINHGIFCLSIIEKNYKNHMHHLIYLKMKVIESTEILHIIEVACCSLLMF